MWDTWNNKSRENKKAEVMWSNWRILSCSIIFIINWNKLFE